MNYIKKGYKVVRDNKSERMQSLLRPGLKEALKKEATQKGTTMNDMLNRILEERYQNE